VSIASGDSTITQTFTLQPGWNSIFVEVQPVDTTPAVVFAGIPVEMVWSYFPTTTPLEYIQDPAEGLWNVAGWNVYLPSHVPDAAALTNLFAVQHHRPYLIKLNGSTPVTLTVTGLPIYKEISWRPDSFTLTGLALDPTVTVRSGDYFFSSTAHKSQPRFRLDPNGTWIALNDNSVLQSGVAYWIFAKGSSTFTAPLTVDLGGSDRLDFGPVLETKDLVIQNLGVATANVLIENPTGFPLVYSKINTTTGAVEWIPLAVLTQSVDPGAAVSISLGIKRLGLPATSDTLLKISAGGVVRKVIVSAENPVATKPNSDTGLWIGTVTLSAVSEPHSANPTVTTTTPAEFNMRLLLHVDDSGATRLLKEVFMMKHANPAGSNAANPGTLVLLSNSALLTQFQTPANRDGARFAPRVSSIGYDFNGADLALAGAFGGTLTGNIVMPRNHPNNPFKHRYHPDHDDLDANFQPPPANQASQQQEVWEVVRALELTFTPPPANQAPSTGFSTRSGTYREEVSGLHKNHLFTNGIFTLRRVNTIGEINPSP
jgi:hypothetical protein